MKLNDVILSDFLMRNSLTARAFSFIKIVLRNIIFQSQRIFPEILISRRVVKMN